MDKQIIFNLLNKELPDTDNKLLYNVAGILYSQVAKWNKEQKKAAVNEIKSKQEAEKREKPKLKRLTDEERAEAVGALLDSKVVSGEITAAELAQFKDLFNLKARDQDILIELMDFSRIDPNGASVIEAVNWQIKEYNDSTNSNS